MNFQTISIKKLNSIFVPKTQKNPNFVIDNNIRLQLQMEAMKLGFIFTEDAILALSQNLTNFSDIFGVLNELVGADKVWKPFYTNFPDEVFEMSELELYLNAITHYFTAGTWRVEEKTSKKVPTFEKVNFKKIGVCDTNDLVQLFKDILSSNGSITDFDRQVIVFAVKNFGHEWISNVNIKFKETLCFFTGLLYTEGVKLNKYPAIKTATDVLRIATYFSEGDITLATKTHFKLKNKQRKFIVKLLEPVIKAEEVAKFKSEWIALFHHLHIGTFSKSKNCNAVAHQLREEKVRTFNSLIEIAIKNRDHKTLFKLLPQNMGDFGRRLDHIMRTVDAGHIVTFFAPENISKVDTRVLVQMLSHFRFRNEKMRIVMPKGVTKKAFILPQQDAMPQEILDIVTSNIERELKRRFTEKESLGKVFIAEELKKAPIPLQMRTASDGLYVMQRGTRIPLDKDKSVLRFFLHWIGNDIDMSACFLTDNLSYHSAITYYNLKTTNGLRAAHSGDITYAPAPNGACEFIDIDLDSITDKSIRYIAMDIRVFSGSNFVNQQANAGWMMRDAVTASRGEIFDAKTVEQRIALSADRQAVVALFDVQEREVIWLDMEGTSSVMNGGNNVASNKASIGQLATMAVNFKNLSLYDLMKLHAESRGTVVENQEEADIVFDKNLIFNYTKVLSEYI
jgi:hypothetical protein